MDGWGDAEARTWLAMDLLAPVHVLWALEVVPGPGGEGPPAVQALTEGLLGEHRPELTEAALAGLLDLERALVVGAALEIARGLVEPDVLLLVECALVDEACRLALLPLVNAAADLLVELERDAVQTEIGQNVAGEQEPGEHEAAQCDLDGPLGLVGSAAPVVVGAPVPVEPVPSEPVPSESAAGARCDEPGRGRVEAQAVLGGSRSRGPPRAGVVPDGGCRAHADRPGAWGQGPRSQSSR